MLARAYSVKIGVIFRRPVWKTKSWYKCKPTWKLKHANSILETFEYFSWKSSKSITTILSYTVSKLVHLLRHSVDLHWPRANPRTAALLPVDIFSDRFVAVRFQAIGVCWRKRAGNNLTEQTISALQMWIQWWAVLVAAVVCRVQSLDVEEERVITQFQISSWSDEVARITSSRPPLHRLSESLGSAARSLQVLNSRVCRLMSNRPTPHVSFAVFFPNPKRREQWFAQETCTRKFDASSSVVCTTTTGRPITLHVSCHMPDSCCVLLRARNLYQKKTCTRLTDTRASF